MKKLLIIVTALLSLGFLSESANASHVHIGFSINQLFYPEPMPVAVPVEEYVVVEEYPVVQRVRRARPSSYYYEPRPRRHYRQYTSHRRYYRQYHHYPEYYYAPAPCPDPYYGYEYWD